MKKVLLALSLFWGMSFIAPSTASAQAESMGREYICIKDKKTGKVYLIEMEDGEVVRVTECPPN